MAVLLLSACAVENGDAGEPVPPGDFAARADAVAGAWRGSAAATAWKTGFIPLSELTLAPEAGFGAGNAKAAFMDGQFRTAIKLPTATAKGAVTFPDGSTLPVTVVSAEAAYQQIDRGEPSCETCGLTVTAVRPGTAKLRTSRGIATVPTWVFTVKEDPGLIARVAVDPGAVTPVPEVPLGPGGMPGGLATAQDLIKTTDTAIDFNLGVGACDSEITPRVQEYDDLIVLGGTVRTSGEVCIAILKLHPASVALTKPIGARPIVEVASGRALWVTG
ncbi:hypothetical protein F4553_003578 [Allocatelliglobosispora scoriae]|uniref:Lipoprotein n=1 Tax=Allocatelliglobosispora scoriae TaxID=643052 RepID=A0A841BSN7_9ACTN|nr:hypothetical protein [Allocatelliglobosispora scoriae]MBB5870199.1 hypothetical protein [Allocatelliglobosispora scoriae]